MKNNYVVLAVVLHCDNGIVSFHRSVFAKVMLVASLGAVPYRLIRSCEGDNYPCVYSLLMKFLRFPLNFLHFPTSQRLKSNTWRCVTALSSQRTDFCPFSKLWGKPWKHKTFYFLSVLIYGQFFTFSIREQHVISCDNVQLKWASKWNYFLLLEVSFHFK